MGIFHFWLDPSQHNLSYVEAGVKSQASYLGPSFSTGHPVLDQGSF